jgi:hypothetical protein
MNSPDEAAIDWLLESGEPGIRLQAERDLMGKRLAWTADQVLAGPIARELLSGQQKDGGFGVHPYQKWMGAHWRLVSLVEVGMPSGEQRVMAALESVLAWFARDAAKERPEDALRIRDLYRVHGSIYANALAVATRLGTESDPRTKDIADRLVLWQWPDGGWNCDRRQQVTSLREGC